MDWDNVILEHYKNGLSIEEITEITPFDIPSVVSSIHLSIKNGLI